MWWQTCCPGCPAAPPPAAVRSLPHADRGDKDKIKLLTSSGSDLQWRHFPRSTPCGRPQWRSITPPSLPIREHARSHSEQQLQHPCRWRSEWSVAWNSSVTSPEAAGTAGGQARRFRRLSRASPLRHTSYQAAHRRQGHVARSQQRRGSMRQKLPAV